MIYLESSEKRKSRKAKKQFLYTLIIKWVVDLFMDIDTLVKYNVFDGGKFAVILQAIPSRSFYEITFSGLEDEAQ